MQRRGKRRGTKQRTPASGLNHRHLICPVDAAGRAHPLVESNEVGAAAEENVLAVIDVLVDTWMEVRTGASTEIVAPLDEVDAVACFNQRASGRKTGDTTAQYGD